MPPLAHLLAPQIMAKAREIEAELGPPQVGYLAQQNVGFEKTPYDPRGLMDKPEEKSFDSTRTQIGAMARGVGAMQRSGDPIAQKVARGFLAGIQGKTPGTQGSYRAPQAGSYVSPTAPPRNAWDRGAVPRSGYDDAGRPPLGPMLMPYPGQGHPLDGVNERGEPAFGHQGLPRDDRRKPLKLKRGEAAGFDEKGESVDPKGKKLGYLTTVDAPMGAVAGKGRELPLKDTARRKVDAPMDYRDKFGAGALIELYTPHLKAMQDRFQETGREEFPPGYFDGMSPAKRKDIEQGVKALYAATITGHPA